MINVLNAGKKVRCISEAFYFLFLMKKYTSRNKYLNKSYGNIVSNQMTIDKTQLWLEWKIPTELSRKL